MTQIPVLEDLFAREVRAGLGRDGQKTLPCAYLYDDVGSALFDAITCLDEYGLTRADARILQAHAGDVTARMTGKVMVAELGSGSGSKTRPILESFRGRQVMRYYPIDLSDWALAKCARDLADVATVTPIVRSYLDGLQEAAGLRRRGEHLLVLFLGSTIGNFEPEAAVDFLYCSRQHLERGDAILLGTDLVKPAAILEAAYDDAAGVTAAFNLNLLARINRELGGDFDLRSFEHVARYCAGEQRVEMHLRSRVAQKVSVQAADLTVEFADGETILTEVCHKFHGEQVDSMARSAGFRMEAQWVDEAWGFAESLLRVE